MKIVFMGTGDFAVPSLEAIHGAGHEVSLVVSQPDRPQGRGLSLRKTPVKIAAERLGLGLFQPEKLRLDPDPVIAMKAEVLVVVAYGQILRESILECANWGAVNVHASLLPKYRGAAPIQWAIASGEAQTGVTTMRLDRGMDTGPILLQKTCAIDPEDTTAALEPRLAMLGAALLIDTLAGLVNGSVEPTPQDEASSTKAPLIRKSDGDVDFSLSADQTANRVRGFSPWPGVQFRRQGRSIRILCAAAIGGAPDLAPVPGTIVRVSRQGLDVACAQGSLLRLQLLQPESRGPVSAFDFANGAKLRAGEVLAGSIPKTAARGTIDASD
ncbi:MAG: methionyl-tRNA formyltransferase [Vicinamibacteria bacterium]|nr:methionyl-tRNA formyltransferase [Vicinamibacteria bacterium]